MNGKYVTRFYLTDHSRSVQRECNINWLSLGMRSYLLLVTPLLTLQAVAGPVFGRLVDPSSSPVKCARVEMICGSDSVAVDTDLAGYFRLDFDSPGFATPTASQGHALGPASPNVFSQTMPSHIFCGLNIRTAPKRLHRFNYSATNPHSRAMVRFEKQFISAKNSC